MPKESVGQTLIPLPPDEGLLDKRSNRVAAIIISILIFGAVLAISVAYPTPNILLHYSLLVLLSLAAGMASFLIGGSISANLSSLGYPIVAGGGLAVFAATLFIGITKFEPVRFTLLDKTGIEALLADKTIRHPMNKKTKSYSLEYHASDGTTEMTRYNGEHVNGQWFVSTDGSKGVVNYTYNGVQTCSAYVILGTADRSVLLHNVVKPSRCPNKFVQLIDGKRLNLAD